jgi:7-carboxy-7-deazaguanine synthase
MFGKNKVSGQFNESGEHLTVNEIFFTIQGEGPDAGRPAIFVRLAKCNLRCFFCDTEFETGVNAPLQAVVDDVLKQACHHSCNLVVITGGEPLLQNIVPLVKRLNSFAISCSVETAGTVILPDLHTVFDPMRSVCGNLMVCSPKTPKIHPELERLVGAWKYIIRAKATNDRGLPAYSTQNENRLADIFVPPHPVVPIYVQPMDEQSVIANEENLRWAADVAMQHGYRLGVQIHKLAGLR